MSARRLCGWGAALALPLALGAAWSPPADGPEVAPRRLRVLHAGGEGVRGVVAGAYRGGDLAVVARAEPAVHLFAAGGHRAWGKRGEGPAELANPVEVAWAGERILVRDGTLGKIASFDVSGRLVATRPAPAGGGVPVGLAVAGSDTLLSFVQPGAPHATVVRLRGARQDTVLRYRQSEPKVTLSASGAPTLTVSAPFAAAARWELLRDGTLAWWDGAADALEVRDRAGRAAGRLPLPRERFPVTRADREAWLATGLPRELRGQDVFAPLREVARREVRFPDRLPAVMDLMADPEGGVWVLRSTAAQGQRWTHLRRGRAPLTVRLPEGRYLLAVSGGEMAAVARAEGGAQAIEIYRKPRPPGHS